MRVFRRCIIWPIAKLPGLGSFQKCSAKSWPKSTSNIGVRGGGKENMKADVRREITYPIILIH